MSAEFPRQWLTPAECAVALSLSISSVRGMIRDGRLPARRLRGSRLLRIARADLERLLEPVAGRIGVCGCAADGRTKGRVTEVRDGSTTRAGEEIFGDVDRGAPRPA